MTTLALSLANDTPHLICKSGNHLEICTMQPEPERPLICSLLRFMILIHEEQVSR